MQYKQTQLNEKQIKNIIHICHMLDSIDAFLWKDTEEGREYWASVIEKLLDKINNETSDGKPLNLEPTEVDVQNHALVYTREYGDHWTGLYRLDNIFIDPKGNKQYVVFSPYCNQHLVMPFCRLATDEELRKHNAKI
jgi:hypothetical protein